MSDLVIKVNSGGLPIVEETLSSGLCTYLKTVIESRTTVEDGGSRTVVKTSAACLGEALAWLLVNKTYSTACTLSWLTDGREGVREIYSFINVTLTVCGQEVVQDVQLPAVTKPTEVLPRSYQGPTEDHPFWINQDGNPLRRTFADPRVCVEIFHLHCHFNGLPGSEAAARSLLEATKAAVRSAGQVCLHDHVWHEKNGPHDPWSWELWLETQAALGVAARHLMRWKRPESAESLGLFVSLHADTGEEMTDHSLRLAWVGPQDPQPLDIAFFPLPPLSYEGPAVYQRRSNESSVVSMGEDWPRDPSTGQVLRKAYGAVDRGVK